MRTLVSSETSGPAAERWSVPRIAAGLPRAWHLLSLDAPSVAAAWCVAFLSASGGPALNRSAFWPALFLSLATWLCYVGDRTLDARASLSERALRERHHFYGAIWSTRRAWLLGAVFCAAVVCVATAFFRLSVALLAAYLALTVIALLYFGWVHWGAQRSARVLAKEAAVAVIFAIGCVLPSWLASPVPSRSRLIPPGLLLVAVCWLNCVAIERWEGEGATDSGAHSSTRWAVRHFVTLIGAGALAAVAWAILSHQQGGSLPLAACLAGAFLLLGVLEGLKGFFSVRALRIFADVALLTPLSWWLVTRLPR